MAARYTDSDIQQLLAERKLLPDEYRKKLKLREKRGTAKRSSPLLAPPASNSGRLRGRTV